MPIVRGLLALLLALCLLLPFTASADASQPAAVQGRIEVPSVPSEPLALRGDWGFAWQQFIDPTWNRLPTTAFAPVPSSWNEVTAGGKPPGEDGWGSYALQVNCPAGQALAVEAVGQRTSSRLFVNGTEVAAHGKPGPVANHSPAAIHTRIPVTRAFPCPLRITLHVSNYEHRAGGFVRPLLVGSPESLARHRESRIIDATFLLSAYLLTALVALVFFAVRRRERTPLLYGLFCIAMALYTDMIGERLLLRPLHGELSWVTYMRIEYLAWIGAMALFVVTLRDLFPADIDRRLVQGIVFVLSIAAVGVAVLPPGVYSYVAWPGQFMAVLTGIYVAAMMVRAQRRGGIDAWLLLGGMLAVLATLAIDLVLIDAPRPDRKFAPIGFALFLLSPAVVIARRLSHALNAEERSRTLEENARLREDVERISRHDLKTPLNSIVGVTRLLGDDTALTPEQRELVGVLQRSGLRMLEMVNLSLGLFRMETGSYEFSAQAVNLREVVTRVLVDLHAYAEARAVTLVLQGSGSHPVYVRGEELLCYSSIANLVKNAIEAAGAGNQVSISVLRGDPVRVTIHNPGEVPPPIAQRFFEKYVTGKSDGTGLGAYSARMMARAQQGDVALRTGAEGTTLTLALQPLKEELPPPVPAGEAAQPVPSPLDDMPARDVLVVDDDEYARLVTRRYLPSPPFRVETSADGQAAVEAMTRRWPHYLLLDMEMPIRSGVETVRWVRQQETAGGKPRCIVVMLSGNDDDASATRALAAGADRFLVKPVSRETLLSTLRELEAELAGRSPGAITTPPVPRLAAAGPEPASSAEDEVVVVDPEWLEVFPGFVRLQRDTVEAMARALAAGKRGDVQFLAHRAFGGLASMGLHWAARQSRLLEEDALHAPVQELDHRICALREHLGKVRIETARRSGADGDGAAVPQKN